MCSWKEFSALATTEKLFSLKFLAHTWLSSKCWPIAETSSYFKSYSVKLKGLTF